MPANYRAVYSLFGSITRAPIPLIRCHLALVILPALFRQSYLQQSAQGAWQAVMIVFV